jgi:hypothetical protein
MKYLLCLLVFTITAGAANVRVEDVPERGVQPQVVVDAAGTAHLIYLKGEPQRSDVRYVLRAKGAKTWSAPISVNSEPGTAVAMGTIRGAQLALGKGGTLQVVWNGAMKAAASGGQGMPLYYTRLEPGQTAFASQRNLLGETGALDGGASIAANDKGDVYVVWHGKPGGTGGDESARVVFVAKSNDNGQTFGAPVIGNADFAGTCACCSIKALATPSGELMALYRAAHTLSGRDLTLLDSKDAGATFKRAVLEPWKTDKCPMSSAALVSTPKGIRAAWETNGKIHSSLLGSTGGQTEIASGTVKHPTLALNARGETLAVWTIGTGWARGGEVAWTMLDSSGRPTAERGKAPGVPVWSHAAAYAEPDGGFVIVR